MKNRLIYILILTIITIYFFNLPYNKHPGDTKLLDCPWVWHTIAISVCSLLSFPMILPLIFAIESFFIKKPFSGKVKALFIVQSIISFGIIMLSLFVMVVLNYDHKRSSTPIVDTYPQSLYMIGIFQFTLFTLWSALLSINYFQKYRVLNFLFSERKVDKKLKIQNNLLIESDLRKYF